MSLELPAHFQIFDGAQEDANHAARPQSFTLFSQLPQELRRKIWRTSLQRERMIQICIHPLQNTNAGSHAHTGYGAAVRGRRVPSKLLRICREARNEALAFYRVHIPCSFTHGTPEQERAAACTAPGRDLLPFSPEYDILQLIPYWPDYTLITDFLLSLCALDPRCVGLRSLAVDISQLRLQSQQGALPPPAAGAARMAALRALFAGLHEVFLITALPLGRMLVPARDRRTGDSAVLLLNSAMPVRAHTPAFTRLPRDSRPIDQDLRRVYMADGHIGAVHSGHAFLARLGIELGDLQAQVSWLVTFEPAREIYSREMAEAFLQGEEDRCSSEQVPKPGLADHLERLVDQGLASAHNTMKGLYELPDVAFGFWRFPLYPSQTFVEKGLGEEEEDGWEFAFNWVTRPLNDLSDCWPELVLMNLAY
ncbi:hypothetical protein M406DRAFT_335214 [Cryphonectria parasitica EP155]|uniref:2EXR domain-containing protein n=1 Tax=Cryphonectria parasitica (strain ATCC 38755 / EP155) TaxID=660469 RepID=A0A9P4XSF2_CRYP1|nr:uncharacterized protein M406DRAFT_335214 [Cryphonectria parasitica EP155]KAF3760002.1 hypothetical protein M406DRAFT_335214 [Cryphonectria parasitica EP155]